MSGPRNQLERVHADRRLVEDFCAAVSRLMIDGVTLSAESPHGLIDSVKVTARMGDWKWSREFPIEELRHSDPILLAEVGVYRPVRQAIAELAKEQKGAAAVAWSRGDRT